MSMSDWSSDVCSSDLIYPRQPAAAGPNHDRARPSSRLLQGKEKRMVRMKLFDAGWAPSPRRVRIFLAEKGVEVETVSIDLRTDEQLAPAYLAVNPRGTVPTLILDNGTVIDRTEEQTADSKTIMREPDA